MSVEHNRPPDSVLAPSDGRTSRLASAPQRRAPWSWLDRTVIDVHGRPIGVVAVLLADDTVGSAAWLGIDVGGLDALDIVIAPTAGARLVEGSVMVAYGRDQVLTAPRALIRDVATAIDLAPPPTPARRRRARRTHRCSR